MKIKALLLTSIFALSIICACGSSKANDNNASAADKGINTEANASSSGNFSDPIYIEDPGTDTVIIEMP